MGIHSRARPIIASLLVFADFAKTFDNVNHPTLLAKLDNTKLELILLLI